jgi:predicted MFS family arabinose efflux permease
VLTVACGTFLLVTTEFLPVGLLSKIAAGLGVTDGRAGLAVTVPGAVAAVAAPVLTLTAGRLDRRIVLWCLTASVIASNLIAMFAPNLLTLLAGRVLLGLSVGGFWTFAIAAGRRLVPEAAGTRATALISAGISIGTVVGVPAGALIGDWSGWREAFGLTAVFGVAVLAAQVMFLPPLPVRRTVRTRELVAMFNVPMARIGLLAALFIAAGHFTAYTYLEPFLTEARRTPPSLVSVVLLIYGVAGIAGTFVGERLIAGSLRFAFLAATFLMATSILTTPLLGGGVVMTSALIGLWGFAFGAVPVCIQIWMYQASPGAYESGSALVVSVFQMSLALGAFLGGFVVDATGVDGAFELGGVLSFVAVAVVGLLVRGRK